MKTHSKSASNQIKQQSHLYVVEQASGIYNVTKNRSGGIDTFMSAGEVIYQLNTDKSVSIEKMNGEVLTNFEVHIPLKMNQVSYK